MSIVEQIEDLIEKNASDFEISKIFKTYISEYKASLPKLFESSQGKDFLVKHTQALDAIIIQMYKTVLRRSFGNYLPMRSSIPIAIVALGSYGREQLCVHSDIDLMIVYEEVEGYQTNKIIEKLLYLAWDAGLKLGHRVHEVHDIPKAAEEDITIRTAFMESRLITGSPFTWHATERMINKVRFHNPKAFILAKIDEAHERRAKNPFSMQPNIKEGVGGLRDSQLLYWIARTIYGVEQLKDLTGTLFTEEAYREYRIAVELLFRVRSALHLITNKQQDQLVLEHMPTIARMLGFKDQFRLTTKVLEASWRINNFSKIFVKKMIRPYLYEPKEFAHYKMGRIAPGYYTLDNRLFASYKIRPKSINDLLELLLGLEDKIWRTDPSFLRQFTYVQIEHPIKAKTYGLLRKLFEREHTYPFLYLFYSAGILHELIPAFKKVHNLPQFDGYHHYPVDLHAIECVHALENIEDPFINDLYRSLTPRERALLKVTVLLHDTGKGRKQDHSEVGVKLIGPFTKHLKFSDEERERAAVLVRHHILMSNVAFRENIHNEKTLYRFMSNVKSADNLKMLYILTYADINGVGPGTYTSFSAKLLRELYDAATEVAQQSDRITDATKRLRIEKRIQNLPAFAELPRVFQKKVLSIESNLFFFKHAPEEILNIALYARNVAEYSYRFDRSGTFSIEIFRRIPLNLGYLLGKLSYLDVASMEICTLFDDIKYFKIDFIHLPEEGSMESIKMTVEEAFDMNREIPLQKPLIKPHEITLDCEHSKAYAQMNVYTANQRGLLAYIIHCFDKEQINIAAAKIHSTKNKARDHFLIEKQNQMCDNARQIIQFLTDTAS
jgi:[protein-PII] uridylyltransferase